MLCTNESIKVIYKFKILFGHGKARNVQIVSIAFFEETMFSPQQVLTILEQTRAVDELNFMV